MKKNLLLFFKALRKLVTLEHYTDHGEKGWDCWLYIFYKNHVCRLPFVSTFSLSVEFVNEVENKTLLQLKSSEIKIIKKIQR